MRLPHLNKQAWFVLFNKHYSSLRKFVQQPEQKLATEPINSRLVDLINYLFLFYLMQVDSGMIIPNTND